MNFPEKQGLQGPRPSPLRINKDSQKIKKPPLVPQLHKPLIIYTVSPKIIHTTPSDFMSLVQRLTGSNSSSSSTSLPSSHKVINDDPMKRNNSGSAISHVARGESGDVEGSISSSFFSPPASDQSMLSFVHSNRNFMEGSFVMSSPSNFVSPHTLPSIDLFNNFLD